MLRSLHQAEVPVGEGERRVAAKAPEDRQARSRRRLDEELRVPVAPDPVEDDAGDVHVAPIARETMHDGCGGGGHRTRVDHQHHRPSGGRRNVRGGALVGGRAVEEPHDPLDEDELRTLRRRRDRGRKRRLPHRPRVEIQASPPARRRVERRVDVVRPHLERPDPHAPIPQVPQQRKASPSSSRSPTPAPPPQPRGSREPILRLRPSLGHAVGIFPWWFRNRCLNDPRDSKGKVVLGPGRSMAHWVPSPTDTADVVVPVFVHGTEIEFVDWSRQLIQELSLPEEFNDLVSLVNSMSSMNSIGSTMRHAREDHVPCDTTMYATRVSEISTACPLDALVWAKRPRETDAEPRVSVRSRTRVPASTGSIQGFEEQPLDQ